MTAMVSLKYDPACLKYDCRHLKLSVTAGSLQLIELTGLLPCILLVLVLSVGTYAHHVGSSLTPIPGMHCAPLAVSLILYPWAT